jgi:hypothetical protein
MEIVVCVIMGIAVLGLLGMLTLAGLLLSQVVKLLRVAASMPPQPQSRDRYSRRQEPRQEPQPQESFAAGALRRRKHEKGEA